MRTESRQSSRVGKTNELGAILVELSTSFRLPYWTSSEDDPSPISRLSQIERNVSVTASGGGVNSQLQVLFWKLEV